MKQAQTHYDKLKVARDAPPEVIRAAYKSLSQKYHPDRNPDNAEAARIMAEINVSYGVLSDPESRELYDMELRQEDLSREATAQNIGAARTNSNSRYVDQEPISQQRQYSLNQNVGLSIIGSLLRNRAFVIIFLLCLWTWFSGKSSLFSSSGSNVAKPQEVKSIEYVRSHTAPNGRNWPVGAGYIDGYEQIQTDGYSTLTVDNSKNDSDVYVTLVLFKIARTHPVRYFYIPAFSKFKLEKITQGIYGIRYQDLNNGQFADSKPFMLEEAKSEKGVQASNVTIGIYKVLKEKS